MAQTRSALDRCGIGPGSSSAATSPLGHSSKSKCLVGKNKCVATKAGALLKCEQKAETPGKDPDPNTDGCVDKAKAKFDGGEVAKGCFEKLEAKASNDCLTFDDTACVEVLSMRVSLPRGRHRSSAGEPDEM